MEAANISVMVLLMIMGVSLRRIPYKSQRLTPQVKTVNIPAEMSFVDWVFQTFINCGINEIVVRLPATIPQYILKLTIGS